MSVGTIGGMNVLEGARRNSPSLDKRMGEVDLPRDGTVLSLLSEAGGRVRAMAEARSAMEKFCDDFLCGILRTINDRSAGTGTGLAWPEGFSMITKTLGMSAGRGSSCQRTL